MVPKKQNGVILYLGYKQENTFTLNRYLMKTVLLVTALKFLITGLKTVISTTVVGVALAMAGLL